MSCEKQETTTTEGHYEYSINGKTVSEAEYNYELSKANNAKSLAEATCVEVTACFVTTFCTYPPNQPPNCNIVRIGLSAWPNQVNCGNGNIVIEDGNSGVILPSGSSLIFNANDPLFGSILSMMEDGCFDMYFNCYNMCNVQ